MAQFGMSEADKEKLKTWTVFLVEHMETSPSFYAYLSKDPESSVLTNAAREHLEVIILSMPNSTGRKYLGRKICPI